MNTRTIWTAGGLATLGLLLAALPGHSRPIQSQEEMALAEMQQRLEEMQRRIETKLASHQEELSRHTMRLAQEVTPHIVDEAMARAQEGLARAEKALANADQISVLASLNEGESWLGVEIREVDADKAKELKLAAERGALLNRVLPDSPAAKAGLKDNDVVMDINSQRVESAIQFRRMIREIPAGRTVQLNIWRDGRAQGISVTLGKAEERHKAWAKAFPSRDFAFAMPDMPEMPLFEWHGEMLPGGRQRLGIDAEDLSGQLGAYFGVPEGEGILVRDVNTGSPAEKAGIKAGDVLIKFNGERIRTVGDLREKLAAQGKEKTAKIGLWRNRSEMSVDVTIESPATPKPRRMSHRTSI